MPRDRPAFGDAGIAAGLAGRHTGPVWQVAMPAVFSGE